MTKLFNKQALGICLAVLGLLVASGNAIAQDELPDAKDLIKKYLKESGGVEKLKAIKSVVTKGKMEVASQGLSGNLEVYQSVGKFLFRVDFPISDDVTVTVRVGCDGETVWEINPQSGNRILDGDEKADALRDNAHPFPEIQWLSEYDGEFKCVGKEKIDGKLAYKVEFTPKEGTSSSRYFDDESGLIVKSTKMQNGTELEIFSSDFKEVDGIKLPHSSSVVGGGQTIFELKIETVEFNAKIADSKFKLPPEIKELAEDN